MMGIMDRLPCWNENQKTSGSNTNKIIKVSSELTKQNYYHMQSSLAEAYDQQWTTTGWVDFMKDFS